jgi:hypothetical protein
MDSSVSGQEGSGSPEELRLATAELRQVSTSHRPANVFALRSAAT